MTFSRTGAELLLKGAGTVIPPAKAEWMRAMAAESSYLPDGHRVLGFAAGCARAACTERLRTLAPDGAWFWPGAAFGVLLLACAMIPGSRFLPMIWAVAGGMLAVLMLGERGRSMRFFGVVGIAFKAGALIGLLFLVAAPLLLLAGGEAVPIGKLARLTIAAAIVTFMATVGGTAVAPLVCRHPDAPTTRLGEETET